jgi:hypothetical protein
MGDPALDDGIANLQRFNALLETTQPALEAAVEAIGERATALDNAVAELRAASADLQSQCGEVEKEAETFAQAAEQALDQIGPSALEDLDRILDALEAGAAENRQQLASELDERGAALQSSAQELTARGFEATTTVLETEQAEFERWAGEGETSIGELAAALTGVQQELDLDRSNLVEDLFWAGSQFDGVIWLEEREGIATIGHQLPEAFEQKRHEMGQDATASFDSLDEAVAEATQTLRGRLGNEAETAAVTLGQRMEASAVALEGLLDGLELAEHGLGLLAGDLTGAQPRVATLVALPAEIEQGDREIEIIRSVTHAMDTP